MAGKNQRKSSALDRAQAKKKKNANTEKKEKAGPKSHEKRVLSSSQSEKAKKKMERGRSRIGKIRHGNASGGKKMGGMELKLRGRSLLFKSWEGKGVGARQGGKSSKGKSVIKKKATEDHLHGD